jgi:hypothetical protein
MEPTVHDVLAFHRVDRAAYEHLLSLGAGRHSSRDAVALLMWFHRKAGVDAVSRVRALVRTQAATAQLVAEARAVLLHGANAESTTTLLTCACGEDDDDARARVRRFLASCGGTADALRRGVGEVLGGAGALVFDDPLHAILRRWHEDGRDGGALPGELAAPYRRQRRRHEDGRDGGALPGELAAPYRRRCVAAAEVQEEDGRSLFITFSKGFPLTRVEVEEFFTEYVATSLKA